MAFSLAMIMVLGLVFSKLFTKVKLPGLLGMLVLGILLGPYGMDWLHEDLLTISGDLRKIALIIILLRAGLGIKRKTITKIGITAIKFSFIPVLFEGFAIMFLGSYILNISLIEAGILGFIIAAVSPAVIVPQMLDFIDQGKGQEKGIPTLILAGASIDDVVAITIFSAFLGMYGGANINITTQILSIPISIILGILMGLVVALGLIYLFSHYHLRDTKKVLIMLGAAITLTTLENALEGVVPMAGLLGVMAIGFIILEKTPSVAQRLSSKLNKIWVLAELVLFVLVGAAVNIYVALDAGFVGVIIISVGLLARSLGVYASLIGTNFNLKEKLFCIIAYIPKATVQAAIGAVPLAAGVEHGELILALAVLSIILTAPLGAIGIKIAGERFLDEEGT
ncbi:sodium/hydrogen exchanger [Alkaliphilus metalliredigens QYMF]|uniref:Sodium/hydrogen exchanger n=1 Tax=Alkaliphilus metalliredigens (strain QYMF) TaxID=293826 RepID=A6TWA9_ALKMQ|nr:cation:proton antiporter [Alkaliphilus metalliredigens]ABR50477.1 sodium/hydrogen exchanger [Alkaliphilus metalliredigens QYMF]